MQQKTDIWAFLLESYQRLFLKSPKLFQIWQRIGTLAALLTGIPLAIQQFELFTGVQIKLPEMVNHWMIRVLFGCGLVMKFMAKLPVTQPPVEDEKEVSKVEALPFTSKKAEETAIEQQVNGK